MNLIKEEGNLHPKNYETLMKEIEEDTHKLEDIPCSLSERINIVEMYILSKMIYRFNILSNFQGIFH